MYGIAALLIGTTLLAGCVATVAEGVHVARDGAIRDRNMEAALAGDAEAQYRVGKAYCCAPRDDADAFYNNQRATEFLCAAARQDHAAAAYEVGEIHAGDRIDGIRLLRRAARAVRGERHEHTAIAYYWYSRAQRLGHADAPGRLRSLPQPEVSRFTDPATTPCTLNEVYGES